MHLASSRRGSTLTRLAAIAACAIVTTTIVTPSAASAASAPSVSAAPKVGECRNYTLAQAGKRSNASPVVPCTQKHTAKVIEVFRLPASTPWNDDRVYPFVVDNCSPKVRTTLGRTERLRHLSAYGFTYFIPNQQQRENGARWVRCDIALYGGTMLRPLPSNAKPMLPAAPLPNRVARCLTGKHFRTTCAQPHAYRATGVTTVANRRFPGEQAMYNIAKRRCPRLVSTPRNWYAIWASKVHYNRGGDRMIVCFSRRSN